MTTIGPYPLVPSYYREYLANYYDNMTSTFTIDRKPTTRNVYYFGVSLTSAQIELIHKNFTNKDPEPAETFIGNLLNVIEFIDSEGTITKSYFIVQFVYGLISSDFLTSPNKLINTYLTGTYLELTGIDFDPKQFINDPRPIVLPPTAVIDTNPENYVACEAGQPLANSTNFIKLRSQLYNRNPEDKTVPRATSFTREPESDLTIVGGITLYNTYFIPIVYTNIGLSNSVKEFIECLP